MPLMGDVMCYCIHIVVITSLTGGLNALMVLIIVQELDLILLVGHFICTYIKRKKQFHPNKDRSVRILGKELIKTHITTLLF